MIEIQGKINTARVFSSITPPFCRRPAGSSSRTAPWPRRDCGSPQSTIIEARNQAASTIFCSQFDIPGWHEYLYDPTLEDAICDRIIHNSHIITIKGDSMRKLNAVTD